MKSSWISPILIGFVVCGFFITVQSAAKAKQKQAGHLVPADKKLSQDAVQRLFVRKSAWGRLTADSIGERGRREVYRGEELDTIGMPIGGVATGQLYLRGDGTLGLWQIFNKHVFSICAVTARSAFGKSSTSTFSQDMARIVTALISPIRPWTLVLP